MRRAVLFVVVVLAAGSVAGCTDQLALRQAQLGKLVGRPEIDLVQIMGIPTRTYETGGTKFLAYEDRRVEVVPGSPLYYSAVPFASIYNGGIYAGGFPPQTLNLVCDTTFTVAGGIVRSFTLRGNACG